MMLHFKGGPWDGIVSDEQNAGNRPGTELTYTRLTGVCPAAWDDTVWKHTYSTYALISTPDPNTKMALFIAADTSYHTHFKQLADCTCAEPGY